LCLYASFASSIFAAASPRASLLSALVNGRFAASIFSLRRLLTAASSSRRLRREHFFAPAFIIGSFAASI
jgi:hypothetical protein